MSKNFIITIKGLVHNPIYIDRNRDERRTVILTGVGRGGTTWLSEILNYQNDYRYIFEPLHGKKVRKTRHFGRRQYLRLNDPRTNYTSVLEDILKGKIRGSWVDHYNKRFNTDQRLIKFIRGNLLMHWIRDQHPEIPIILLIRNPFATVASQLRGGWEPDFDQLYFNQPELMEDLLGHHKNYLESLEPGFEKLVGMWCVDNFVFLSKMNPGSYYPQFYEQLILKPETSLQGIMAYLKKPFHTKMLSGIENPSRIVGRGYSHEWGEALVSKWKKEISAKQITKGKEILEHFGLAGIYPDNLIPDINGLTIN